MQPFEQRPPRRGDLAYGRIERGLVGARRRPESADLTHELKRRVVQLLIGRLVIGVAEAFDVPAHDGVSSNGVLSSPRESTRDALVVAEAVGRCPPPRQLG